MIRIEHTIEVATNTHAAFQKWMQYDSYPLFMENVHEVKEIAPNRLHWRASRHDVEVEWESELTEVVQDRRIVWRDIGADRNDGSINFHEDDETHCRIQLILHVNLHVIPQKIAAAEIALIERVEADLARFKALIEHPEAKPFDASSPATTGVEYSHHPHVDTNDLATNTPGSPRVPNAQEMSKSPGADGKDNRLDLD